MNAQEQQPALATLTRFYEAETAYLASGTRDFSGIAATLDPECVIYQPASLPYGGTWRGHAGFEAWMQAFAEIWSSLEVKSPEIFPIGDVLVSRSHVYAKVRRNQREADWPLLQFFRVREARILELRPFYWDTATLLEAINHL